MTPIKGHKFLTIFAEADGEYKINYVKPPRLSILNSTGGDIYICVNSAFSQTESEANFMIIPKGVAVNDVIMPFSSVYIKATEDGNIVIERCV